MITVMVSNVLTGADLIVVLSRIIANPVRDGQEDSRTPNGRFSFSRFCIFCDCDKRLLLDVYRILRESVVRYNFSSFVINVRKNDIDEVLDDVVLVSHARRANCNLVR